MGLWDRLRGELIDVIEWTGSSQQTLVHRFERYGNEIKYGAVLTVREGQVAVFVNEGEVADVFEPGTYELETANLPSSPRCNPGNMALKARLRRRSILSIPRASPI